ncbi:DUF4091 domain-containing protein [Paenibacillus thiaminolyticus]|uniref:DUF4091 domain-containing protein n=1 Tax=Paenibacillus thiaminolyticus TaxID=49283 RepID=A0A3A3GPY3_PANTH|nr:DUF4091 domain-containing protein [Paenibacillus thiaminolyticus]RJG25272.1 DUF4091 domain-containing protein [Paenibacillus thiaminolyticus]
MKYEIFSANEWLYPDSHVDKEGCRRIQLPVARGSYAACQILFNDVAAESSIEYEVIENRDISLLQPEIYQLLDIYVEKNTGPIGFCVQEGESAEGYTTRQAPFRVYEAMNPLTADVRTRSDTEALYIAWKIPTNAEPGQYTGELVIQIGEKTCSIPYQLEVYPATVPAKESLSIINWFILGNMAKRYNLEQWSEEHWAMIRRYGEVMRRARQTHFWVPMEAIEVELVGENQYRFNFDRADRLIRLYLSLGFSGIEGGLLAGRQEFMGSEFVIWNHWNGGDPIKAISFEGYAYLSQFLPAWREFLQKNGWLDILIQHVADEPTENSKEEYRILAGIVRKFMPGVPLLEAVETSDLSGAVDIWIPKNSYYLEHREEFERLRALGDKLWYYTCCFPGGSYVNRLWDMPLLRSRYLHWGNYKYDMEGFLHWGLNWCPDDKDPFNHTDIFFPPGDTHIVYPGANGPLTSMRFEAMRAGAEDYELLRILASHDKELADEIAASCMISFNEVREDIVHFADAHRHLLQAVSKYT